MESAGYKTLLYIARMNQKEFEEKISLLEEQVQTLQEANHKLQEQANMLQQAGLELLNRNMQLSQQLDIYYDVRRRIQMLKELVIRHQELMNKADMRNDDELMALIETRLEQEHPYEDPNFGLAELADYIGTSKSRLIKLFRNLNFYRSADDYLDYMRLLRSLYYLQSKPSWGIAACAQEAGFAVVRTYNRKFLDIIGMTPGEFRQMLEAGRKSEH